jgi:hypothetical protein
MCMYVYICMCMYEWDYKNTCDRATIFYFSSMAACCYWQGHFHRSEYCYCYHYHHWATKNPLRLWEISNLHPFWFLCFNLLTRNSYNKYLYIQYSSQHTTYGTSAVPKNTYIHKLKVLIHTYIHTCIHTHIHTYIHILKFFLYLVEVDIHTYIHTYKYLYSSFSWSRLHTYIHTYSTYITKTTRLHT